MEIVPSNYSDFLTELKNFFFSKELDDKKLQIYEKILGTIFNREQLQDYIDKNIKDSDKTPFFYGLTDKKLNFFLDQGFQIDVNFTNKNGQNALFFKQNQSSIDYLLKNGINYKKLDRNGEDFTFFCNFNTFKSVIKLDPSFKLSPKLLFSNLDLGILEYVLKNKLLDPNTADSTGKTPIFFTENLKKIELLLKYGADINHKDETGSNAALYANNISTIKFLEKNGIDLYNISHKETVNLLSLNQVALRLLELASSDSEDRIKSKSKKLRESRIRLWENGNYNIGISKEKFEYLYVDKKIPILPCDEYKYLTTGFIDDDTKYKHLDICTFIKNNEDKLLEGSSYDFVQNKIKEILTYAVSKKNYTFNNKDFSYYKNTCFYNKESNLLENLFLKSGILQSKDKKNNIFMKKTI